MRREVGKRTSALRDLASPPHVLRWLKDDRVLFASDAGGGPGLRLFWLRTAPVGKLGRLQQRAHRFHALAHALVFRLSSDQLLEELQKAMDQLADGYLYLGRRDLLLREGTPAYILDDRDYMVELRRRGILGGGMLIPGFDPAPIRAADENAITHEHPDALPPLPGTMRSTSSPLTVARS